MQLRQPGIQIGEALLQVTLQGAQPRDQILQLDRVDAMPAYRDSSTAFSRACASDSAPA